MLEKRGRKDRTPYLADECYMLKAIFGWCGSI